MSAFVLDASVTAAWLFGDEDDPRTDAALTNLENGMALATLDTALARAAVAEGLALVEPMNRSRPRTETP